MRKIILLTTGSLLILLGTVLVLYPFISNYLMGMNQQAEINGYREQVSSVPSQEIEDERRRAEAYNEGLIGQAVLHDPFKGASKSKNDEYDSLLNLGGDGVMGYIEIPVIGVSLPVYHGTENSTLEKGIGHLHDSSLPVGGKGTHAVLTGHSGLSTAKQFTDLDRLKKGDIFLIYTLGDTLAYQIDRIKTVLPDVTDDLSIRQDEDLCTLITCTPYGVNSHRLLVRGRRIPYSEENRDELLGVEPVGETTWMAEYRNALLVGAAAFAGIMTVLIVLWLIIKRKRRDKTR